MIYHNWKHTNNIKWWNPDKNPNSPLFRLHVNACIQSIRTEYFFPLTQLVVATWDDQAEDLIWSCIELQISWSLTGLRSRQFFLNLKIGLQFRVVLTLASWLGLNCSALCDVLTVWNSRNIQIMTRMILKYTHMSRSEEKYGICTCIIISEDQIPTL